MEHVEDLGAKVNKCSYVNEYINFFCNIGQVVRGPRGEKNCNVVLSV